MAESFHVHLASNVAPDTFPNNTPYDFKTPLAEELRLHGAAWEVAVKDIMYPCYVSSTTTADKLYFHKYNFNLEGDIPYRVENGKYMPYIETLEFPVLKNVQDKAKYVCDVLNSTYLGKTGIIRLEYREESEKFILHLYRHVLLTIDVRLQTYLGFKQRSFYKGSTWTWSPFDGNENLIRGTDIQVHEYQALQSQTLELKPFSNDVMGAFIEKVLPTKEVKRPFEVFISEKRFVIRIYEKGEFAIVQFDADTAKALLIEQFHVIHPKEEMLVFELDPNGKGITTGRHSITVYFSAPKPSTVAGLSQTPDDFIELLQNTDYKSPRDFLKQLNSKAAKFKYKFSFSPANARFQLENKGQHCIKMSESLSSILGYERNDKKEFLFCETAHQATYPPLLHRGINNLFVYSNIVNSVLVGNTKAPLLLVCAFKESSQGIMVHQEFLNPTFVPVSRSSIHQIDILVRDEVGQAIPFLYGKTVLTLQFRKR